MTLDLTGCTLVGPALTTAFLADGLPPVPEADHAWQRLRRTLAIGEIRAGESADRVLRSVVLPIATALGYGTPVRQKNLPTREGEEDGGWLATSAAATLRMWPVTSAANLDALHRHNPLRTAFRVLFAQKEPIGLLTDGASVFILVSDAARSDTCLCLSLAGWRDNDRAPDTWQLLWTLLAAARRPNLPKLLESARLYQTRITSALRIQAGEAITGFINALPDRTGLSAADLWHDALILIHRLLFVLKLEASGPQGEGFSFTATNLWRNALSPNRALGALVRRHLDHGVDTGHMLEDGLRAVFAILRDGLRCRELSIAALATTVGGSLFGTALMPHLDSLRWGDRAVALLLDRLLWLPGRIRSRVHYGSLGVEDLGGVYEALLELEPAIEDDRFVLRPGLRRKTSGTYYTPHEFVRFLVCQTLDPAIEARSTPTDPNPAALLAIRVVDPSCGSGHFLVEACRHLAEALLNASHQADRLGLHSRVAELPDSGALLPYLPSRGDNEAKALAVCRRFIAVHCLYGCDRNPLAVELAKLSLWLESWAEGLPLTFLDHRLVCGDALTGPFGQSLTTLPVTGGPIDPLLAHDVETAITRRLSMARDLASILNTSIGRDLPDISTKLAAKSRFDLLLAPLRQLAAAWTAAAMMGTRDADDRWLAQARTTLATASLDPYTPIAAIRRSDVIDAAGSVPSTDIESDALPWDLAFPEVFPGGFTAVLGNPPWDVLQPNRGDFLATQVPHSSHDKRKRAGGSESAMLLTQPAVAARYAAYREGFARMKRIAPKLGTSNNPHVDAVMIRFLLFALPTHRT